MDNLKGLKYGPIICTAIYTGMREGEILALKWKNVHLDKGYIEVKESVKRVAVFDKDGNKKMQTITSEPKTANSKRIIYIPNKLISIGKPLNIPSSFLKDLLRLPSPDKKLFS